MTTTRYEPSEAITGARLAADCRRIAESARSPFEAHLAAGWQASDAIARAARSAPPCHATTLITRSLANEGRTTYYCDKPCRSRDCVFCRAVVARDWMEALAARVTGAGELYMGSFARHRVKYLRVLLKKRARQAGVKPHYATITDATGMMTVVTTVPLDGFREVEAGEALEAFALAMLGELGGGSHPITTSRSWTLSGLQEKKDPDAPKTVEFVAVVRANSGKARAAKREGVKLGGVLSASKLVGRTALQSLRIPLTVLAEVVGVYGKGLDCVFKNNGVFLEQAWPIAPDFDPF